MKMNFILFIIMSALIGLTFNKSGLIAQDKKPEIIEVRKIWDQGKHNAFTDLIRFHDKWFCTFRESDSHAPVKTNNEDGKIRIITSTDGITWESAGLLKEEGIDLRDPKLSITADDRLMVIMGGSTYVPDTSKPGEKIRVAMHSRVAFSPEGKNWTNPQKIKGKGLKENDTWLWRVTWHNGKAYGFTKDPAILWRSADGITYEPLSDALNAGDEVTVRFLPDDEMMALFRIPGAIGTSKPPYNIWDIHLTSLKQIGGPNFIILPYGQIWGGGRNARSKTVLAKMTKDSFDQVLELPCGGDTSYPGFILYNGLLWMSYYSSHEEKTSIYLAKIKMPEE